MYKRPILMLMIMATLMIFVGTSFAGQEGCNKPTAQKTGSTVNQNTNCCEGTSANCKTGKACTPEQMEKCKASCQAGSTKVCNQKSTCGTGHGCSKVNATKSSQKSTTSSKCNLKQGCQPKQCGSKNSI